jgi:PIN domain nuclease of toxin-antitoxin system
VKLLLDSHTLLWWLIDDPRLSSRAREAIQQATASVFVSAASVWEIAIKAAKGKLRLPPGAEDRIRSAMASAGFVELPVTWDHAFAVRSLNAHHLDPLDRLLIVQSRIEGLAIVSNDKLLRRYDVNCLW